MEVNELNKAYEEELHLEILSLGKFTCFTGIIAAPLYYLKDILMTKYVESTLFWRMLPFLASIFFLVVLHSKLRESFKIVRTLYILNLFTGLIMVTGIFYQNYGKLNDKFNSLLIISLITILLIIHIFGSPIRKFLGLFFIAVILFFMSLFIIKGGTLFILSNLVNPALIIMLIWIISIRDERKKFNEFKSRFLLELSERDLRNEIEYRENIERELKEIVIIDPLTNTHNRRAAEKIIPEKIENLKREFHKLSLAYIDIDGLKVANDTIGHDAGDKMLIEFTNITKKHLLPEDYLFRVGGDEFILLFINKYLTEAHNIIDIIAKECEEKEIFFSHGISIIKNKDNINAEELIKNADIKMYNNKRKKKISALQTKKNYF